jgi:hypothetical protein
MIVLAEVMVGFNDGCGNSHQADSPAWVKQERAHDREQQAEAEAPVVPDQEVRLRCLHAEN